MDGRDKGRFGQSGARIRRHAVRRLARAVGRACAAVGLWAACATGTTVAAGESDARQHLPDFSEGQVGRLGPFRWARAADFGEDVRFSNAEGLPDPEGTYLWLYQFTRLPHKTGYPHVIHARNNLTSLDPARAWQVQPAWFLHNTEGAHNSKIIFGYMATNWWFTHADNNDLAHLAGADRVVLFCPVRKDFKADPARQDNYRVSAEYAAQSFSVVEFKAGDIISYDWFANPTNFDRHILCDLAPLVAGTNAIRPGVTRPLMRFDIADGGGWTFRLKRDGRDGLKGGDHPNDWDVVVTDRSPGAKPYSVNVTRQNSAWVMTVFSPGGAPVDTSEILVGMTPYNRDTGAAVPWPARTPRIRDTKQDDPALTK